MAKKRAEKKKERTVQEVISNIYRRSWDYIKSCRTYIYWAIIIFLLFFIFGFFIPAPADVQTKILEYIQELLSKTQGLSQTQLISFIFANNVQTAFESSLFGVVLGVFPAVASISNGYLLGFVSVRVVQEEGVFVLWRLLPHGIFELPALFISLGMGIKLGTFIFKKKKLQTLREYLLRTAEVFIFVVVPLLFIAAIIEGSLISLLG